MTKKSTRALQDRFLTIGKLVLLAGILIVAFIFSMIFGMRFAVRGTVVEVPSLQGMSTEDAADRLKRLDLDLTVQGKRYDADVPAGAIISHWPGPGVDVKANREVQAIVSLGRRTNPVPDLKGASLRAARILVEQNGYELGLISELSGTGNEDGRIISQFPPPQSVENVSPQIDVLVSRVRPVSFVMPRVIQKNMNHVLRFLKDHGFDVDRIEYRSLAGVTRGTIVRQFPEPGYLLNQGDPIHLEVAR